MVGKVTSRDNGTATLSMAGTGGYATLGPDGERRALYRRIATGDIDRESVAKIDVPARTGRCIRVDQGHVLRVACPQGRQVADCIVFNAGDPEERFWAARTRVIHGGHLSVGHQLWSTPPHVRPMMTLIADTVEHTPLPHGARAHDLLFCRCDVRHYERSCTGARRRRTVRTTSPAPSRSSASVRRTSTTRSTSS